MLVIQRSSSVLSAVEDDHVLITQGRQRKPSSNEIVSIQKIILRLEFNSVQDHLRPNGAVLVQDQFVARTEQPEREVFAIACECWRSLLAASSPGFSRQAVSHIELELGCVSSTVPVHGFEDIGTSKGVAET
jgi:hypothetical protein